MTQQEELVILLRDGPVTPLRSWVHIGCYRPADPVEKLRKRGYIIDTVMKEFVTTKGKKVRFAEYHLVKEPHGR